MALQLDLFESEETLLVHENKRLSDKLNHLRRSFFVRHNEHEKQIEKLLKEVIYLKTELRDIKKPPTSC